ncbi:hypothetical protein N8Y44_22715 [Enterobacter hormaechei subsp. xiangfangensis]|nr:hypothetical protein [Enterobacter hormaechei subsp. xiangfangensis]MCU3468636.1 hypothetical protein [Enterobacter hormaechei subsp. xiangfangensis]
MAIDALPEFIKDNYQCLETNHATAILQNDFPNEWKDLIEVLSNFRLYKTGIVAPGGRKSTIADSLDAYLYARGWEEKQFKTSIIVDEETRHTPTHKVDCYKNRIAIEIEWNNKDPFYDRDLNNFRLLFERDAISVGVIITRSTELQQIFNDLGKGASYGSSTTHWQRLIPRIHGGGAGGCPVIAFGITKSLYIED